MISNNSTVQLSLEMIIILYIDVRKCEVIGKCDSWRWQHALDVFAAMRRMSAEPNAIACNAAVSAFGKGEARAGLVSSTVILTRTMVCLIRLGGQTDILSNSDTQL